MRPIGKLHPTQDAYVEPETGITIAVTTATTAQAYPAEARFMSIQTTVAMYVSLDSTSAHIPSASIAATTSSTGRQVIASPNRLNLYQITSKTTSDSFSVAGTTSGVAVCHFYGTG